MLYISIFCIFCRFFCLLTIKIFFPKKENNILTILNYFIIIAIQGCTNCIHGSCDSNNNCVCNAGYTGLYCDTRKFKYMMYHSHTLINIYLNYHVRK